MNVSAGVLAIALLAGAALAAVDLRRAEAETLVVYTTPALKDVLERDVVPRFQNATGERVELVYVAAGEQYNRLRLSGEHPEADVFLHASPLFLEKGYAEGYFEAFAGEGERVRVGEGLTSREVEGGYVWRAWAWSPLVAVYTPTLGEAPDLATSEVDFGIPDPMLSNNGVYAVVFFEELDPAAGKRALDRTKTQPVNAASNIGGLTDGSFELTLGYEAVALLYQGKGAYIAFDLPRLDGEAHVLPVLMSAGIVNHHRHGDAQRFVDFLFTNETQAGLARHHLRSIDDASETPAGALDLSGAKRLDFDWSTWADLEAKLDSYVVRR